MNINAVRLNNQFLINRFQKNENSKSNNNLTTNNMNSASFVSYPQNYYLSFGALSLKQFLSDYEGKDRPTTLEKYIENHEQLLLEEQREAFRQEDMQKILMESFADLEGCYTVQDVKKNFPNEKFFEGLRTVDEYKDSIPFFAQIKEMENKGEKYLKCEEDIPTFLIKKIFLEGKKHKTAIKELSDVLVGEDLKNELAKYEISGNNFFKHFGFRAPDGRTFQREIQQQSVGNKNNKYFANFTPEQVNEKIETLLVGGQKSRYAMKDAWNHCEEVRSDLSKFLIENASNYIMLLDDCDENMDIYESGYYNKMQVVMNAFWEKYPEHKEKLGLEIKIALDKYDKVSAMPEEDFEKYKQEINQKSNEIKKIIKAQRKEIVSNFEKILDILNAISSKLNNIYSIKTDSTVQDFTKLLFRQLSCEDRKVLEGNKNTSEYKNLIPAGMKMKIKKTTQTPSFVNFANSQYIALFDQALNEGKITENDFESILFGEKTINELIKENSLKEDENLQQQASIQYDKLKKPLNKEEKFEIRHELMKYNPNCSDEDISKMDAILSTQGKYLKFALDENPLKEMTHVLFWSEFDRINGTEFSKEVANVFNIDKFLDNALSLLENDDLFNQELIGW